jgi:hypothetical protein
LTRNIKNRLGCSPTGKRDIMDHAFFRGVEWDKLAKLEVPPPFKPKQAKKGEAANFDPEFTSERPVLTPTDKRLVDSIDQSEFKDFTFTNTTFKA